MTLEQPNFPFVPVSDARKRLEEPLPVTLEAVADMHVPTPRVPREEFDRLYLTILEFAPLPDPHYLVYRAENFNLRFDLPRRELLHSDYRYVKIVVQSLAATEAKLVEAEIEYQRQKGITPGQESLLLTDADGNWLEIREHREIG
jgi:hypothetical protein